LTAITWPKDVISHGGHGELILILLLHRAYWTSLSLFNTT